MLKWERLVLDRFSVRVALKFMQERCRILDCGTCDTRAKRGARWQNLAPLCVSLAGSTRTEDGRAMGRGVGSLVVTVALAVLATNHHVACDGLDFH